jgi:hypothetical protein
MLARAYDTHVRIQAPTCAKSPKHAQASARIGERAQVHSGTCMCTQARAHAAGTQFFTGARIRFVHYFVRWGWKNDVSIKTMF